MGPNHRLQPHTLQKPEKHNVSVECWRWESRSFARVFDHARHDR
ncbi:Uncharacterised protein [Vibrio cholerae]|nr:Uncharacterised protein [Vibrio cholerae]